MSPHDRQFVWPPLPGRVCASQLAIICVGLEGIVQWQSLVDLSHVKHEDQT